MLLFFSFNSSVLTLLCSGIIFWLYPSLQLEKSSQFGEDYLDMFLFKDKFILLGLMATSPQFESFATAIPFPLPLIPTTKPTGVSLVYIYKEKEASGLHTSFNSLQFRIYVSTIDHEIFLDFKYQIHSLSLCLALKPSFFLQYFWFHTNLKRGEGGSKVSIPKQLIRSPYNLVWKIRFMWSKSVYNYPKSPLIHQSPTLTRKPNKCHLINLSLSVYHCRAQ